MTTQLQMALTEDQLKKKRLQLKLKRQHLRIINQDRARLINEIEALRIEVGEPDTPLIEHRAELARIEAEMRGGDEEC